MVKADILNVNLGGWGDGAERNEHETRASHELRKRHRAKSATLGEKPLAEFCRSRRCLSTLDFRGSHGLFAGERNSWRESVQAKKY